MRRLAVTALTIALLAIPAVASSALAAPTCGGLAATIVGSADAEVIVGTFGPDVIMSRGGRDTVIGLSGDDVICAGGGRDVVLGGRGDDQLFGENGNDRLFGGPGFDALDGGPDTDRCVVGLGGGTQTACGSDGSFDLAVEVSAPARVNDEESFQFSVVVRNLGSAPSGEYRLVVTESRTNVACSFDPSESVQRPSLGAGQSSERFYSHDEGCRVQSGSDYHVDLTVEVQPTGTDGNAANNSASDSVTVIPPTIG